MLALKLLLVPCALLLISLAGRRWGAAVAGWLAGLPVVVGPILLFLAIEQGNRFAAGAATAALAAVLANVVFLCTYAQCAVRLEWPWTLALAVAAWLAAAALVWLLPLHPAAAAAAAAGALVAGPRAFPRPDTVPARPVAPRQAGGAAARLSMSMELGARMLAGALLVLTVTRAASLLGDAWSGLLAVFPVIGSVLSVFSHRTQGAAYAIVLQRAMTTALTSLAVFCLVLAVALPRTGVAAAFCAAVAGALAAHAVLRWRTLARMRAVRRAPPSHTPTAS